MVVMTCCMIVKKDGADTQLFKHHFKVVEEECSMGIVFVLLPPCVLKRAALLRAPLQVSVKFGQTTTTVRFDRRLQITTLPECNPKKMRANQLSVLMEDAF